jgi:hypothetical protein
VLFDDVFTEARCAVTDNPTCYGAAHSADHRSDRTADYRAADSTGCRSAGCTTTGALRILSQGQCRNNRQHYGQS